MIKHRAGVMARYLLFSLLLGCFVTCTNGLLNITIPVKLNNDITLPCRLPSDSASQISVRWFSGKNGWLTVGTRVYKFAGQIEVGKPAPNEWNLRIKKVTQSFDDVYTCEKDNGEMISYVRLVIETEPMIDERLSSHTRVNFTEHSDAILKCIVSGTPKPTVTWYRGDSEKPLGISGSQLIFRKISRYAMDAYYCWAENKYGIKKRRIDVDVNFPPEVTVMKPEVYATGGEVAVMSCVVQGHPIISVYWTEGDNANDQGTPIKANWKYLVTEEDAGENIPVKFVTLIFRKAVITVHDYGSYTCVARGVKDRAQATVELKKEKEISAADGKVVKYN